MRASIRRNVSRLSFANFVATSNEDDRDRNADAGNPELVPEKEWSYSVEAEYRLPEDAAVFSIRLFHADIEDFIGRINATIDPSNLLSAVGNIGRAERHGITINASTRLGYWNLPDAMASLRVDLFDSKRRAAVLLLQQPLPTAMNPAIAKSRLPPSQYTSRPTVINEDSVYRGPYVGAAILVGSGRNRANHGRTGPPCWRADPALRRSGT